VQITDISDIAKKKYLYIFLAASRPSLQTISAMRNTLIFAGSSIPELTAKICTNLGMDPAGVELSQFANVGFETPSVKVYLTKM
jgi:hypothetical protein